MIRRIAVFVALIFLVFPSCRKEKEAIPYVYVDFYVSVTDPNFSALNAVGGWVYVTGGSKGIIIYRKNNNEFMAFDRHCPWDPSASCSRLDVQSSGLIAEDACCTSTYLLMDGSPSAGPGTSGQHLLKYQTTFDGTTIHVFN